MARVYVGNVPYRSTEDEIRSVFQEAGATEVVIPKLHDGRSKGFAFVEVDNLEAALALDGKELDGRPLRISEARPMQPRDGGAPRAEAPVAAPAEETTVDLGSSDDSDDE